MWPEPTGEASLLARGPEVPTGPQAFPLAAEEHPKPGDESDGQSRTRPFLADPPCRTQIRPDYETPVILVHIPEGLIAGLTYGDKMDCVPRQPRRAVQP